MPGATFRFYAELNDFLRPEQRARDIVYRFSGRPAVKDSIEALGVPHTEVDLILVDGVSVDFAHRLQDGARVSVYPVFEGLDITPLLRLRAKPLRVTRFVVDSNLGKLAVYLRLLGFDTLYRNDWDDAALAAVSRQERRILLTRDQGLLKRSAVTHGYYLRATQPRRQAREVLLRFDLARGATPFRRCLRCNGEVRAVPKAAIEARLPPRVRACFSEFHQCAGCGRVYWAGSHYQRMRHLVTELTGARGEHSDTKPNHERSMCMTQTSRIALVTGCNRGIGLEVCRQLARQGHSVILTSRDPDKGREAAESLQQQGLAAHYHVLDVTRPEQVAQVAEFVRERFGRLDILVNNAGVFLDGVPGKHYPSALEVDVQVLRDTMEVNLYGPLRLCQTFVPMMLAQGYGRVVNISSGMGQLSDMNGCCPGYRTSKTALNALTRLLADELRGSNVLVNSLCPGWVRTDMGGPDATRDLPEGADTVVWLATLPDGGPSGGFFRDRQPIPW